MMPASTGPAFQIETSTTKTRWLKTLIYGDFGVGKTYLAGSSAGVEAMRDIIMLNIESGDLTLDVEQPDIPFDAIDYIPAKTFGAVARAYEFLKEHCVYRDANDEAKLAALQERFGIPTSEGIRKYNTVIVDSLTEIDAMSMDAVLGISERTKIDADTIPAEWTDFRQNLSKMVRFIRSMRDLPMNVLFIAGQSYNQDEMKKYRWFPTMTGQLSNKVQGFVDLVGFYRLETGSDVNSPAVRRLYVQPTTRWNAKCRFSRYKKPYFENPTMTSILQQVGLLETPTSKGKA
jgi:hypothetical protein